MQMIDVLKRLAELDAKNPNVVKETKIEKAVSAYNQMSVGDNPWKNRTGLAGDQSDRLKSRMDKRWGKDEVDAAIQKSREQGVTKESDDDLVGMVQSTIEDILSGAQQGHDMTDNIADELGDHFDAVQNSGDENLQQAYSMVRDAADTSPEEQAQAAQSALEMLSGGEQGMAEAANPKIDTRATEKYALKVVNDLMYDPVGREARYLTTTAGLPFTYYNEDELQKTGVAKFNIPYVDDDTPQGSNGIGSKYEALENIWTHYFRGKQAEGWLSSQPRQMPTGKTTSDGKKIWTFVFGFAIPNKGQQFEQQGVAEGSSGNYTFTTALNGMLGDDKEFEVTYYYDKGADAVTHGSLPSDGRPASVEIISVKDLETGQDVSKNTVGKNIWAEFEEAAEYDYIENHRQKLGECGMMGSGMSPRPHSPASINMTADSGAELTGMLKDIMQLAGLKQVTPQDLGHEHEPAVISAEPGISIAKVDDEPSIMRSMLDKLNPEMDDEEKIAEWDNEPTNVDDIPPMSQDAMLNKGMHNQDPAGAPGAGDGRHLKNNPIATPEETYESLMADYKKFISEN